MAKSIIFPHNMSLLRDAEALARITGSAMARYRVETPIIEGGPVVLCQATWIQPDMCAVDHRTIVEVFDCPVCGDL